MKEQLKEKMLAALVGNGKWKRSGLDNRTEQELNESLYGKKAEACATICEEQEKNTAVAFHTWMEENIKSSYVEDGVCTWYLYNLDLDFYSKEQLFQIFKDNQNGK